MVGGRYSFPFWSIVTVDTRSPRTPITPSLSTSCRHKKCRASACEQTLPRLTCHSSRFPDISAPWQKKHRVSRSIQLKLSSAPWKSGAASFKRLPWSMGPTTCETKRTVSFPIRSCHGRPIASSACFSSDWGITRSAEMVYVRSLVHHGCPLVFPQAIQHVTKKYSQIWHCTLVEFNMNKGIMCVH